MTDIDKIVRENTAFTTLEDMTRTHPNYRPSLMVVDPNMLIIADAYDEMMEERGDERRAFRFGPGVTR